MSVCLPISLYIYIYIYIYIHTYRERDMLICNSAPLQVMMLRSPKLLWKSADKPRPHLDSLRVASGQWPRNG